MQEIVFLTLDSEDCRLSNNLFHGDEILVLVSYERLEERRLKPTGLGLCDRTMITRSLLLIYLKSLGIKDFRIHYRCFLLYSDFVVMHVFKHQLQYNTKIHVRCVTTLILYFHFNFVLFNFVSTKMA